MAALSRSMCDVVASWSNGGHSGVALGRRGRLRRRSSLCSSQIRLQTSSLCFMQNFFDILTVCLLYCFIRMRLVYRVYLSNISFFQIPKKLFFIPLLSKFYYYQNNIKSCKNNNFSAVIIKLKLKFRFFYYFFYHIFLFALRFYYIDRYLIRGISNSKGSIKF